MYGFLISVLPWILFWHFSHISFLVCAARDAFF
jgi:hypothetical protein